VRTWIWPTEMQRSSLRLEFAMNSESDGRLLAEGYGVLVGYDYGAGKSRPLPDELRQKLEPELVG
jgi:acyl-CoA thioester hydrolase